MQIREFRALTDEARMFAAMYGMRMISDVLAPRNRRAHIAGYFAGINVMSKDEFIRVMNGAGKELLRQGIDCRTDAERVRHQLHQIQIGQPVS